MTFTQLITVQQLSEHLMDPSYRIIDCRFDLMDPSWGREEHEEFHIPGSTYAHLDEDLAGLRTPQTGRHPLPEIPEWIQTASRLGIDRSKQVVVYDGQGGAMAVRLWWLLRHYGHFAVALLDGGIGEWLRAGLPTQSGTEIIPRSNFTGSPNPQEFVTTDMMKQIYHDPDYLVIDARSAERYRGEAEPIDPVAGHIPGAVNRFHGLNLGTNGKFLPPDVLRQQFETLLKGYSPLHTVVYCGSGITSIHHLLAMEIAGLPGARLYAGSWSEWIRDSANPIALGEDNLDGTQKVDKENGII
ncbi:MAG: sulfurtransferase [Anaerolineaceae bacterium]